MVAKPSEMTPMTAYLFSKICQIAKFPKGVINIVHGYGNQAGDALSRHPDVPVVSFTGGTETGEKIASVAAPMEVPSKITFTPGRGFPVSLSRTLPVIFPV